MEIVNLFYELARQHKQLNGFFYGKSYEKGAANEAHPLLWLDDPIYGQAINQTIRYTINIDILGVPSSDKEVLDVQTAAFNVGLTIVEKIKKIRGYSIDGFSFVSLRDYYDNNAAGQRFTYTIVQANPVDLCADNFDPEKQFPRMGGLPEFKVDNPDGCAIFNDKTGLPNFKLNG